MDTHSTTTDTRRDPKETRERRCPRCLGGQVTPTGTVTASIRGVQVGYHCHDCSEGFVLLP